MLILVTGGSGFIGKNLVEQLSGRHQVLAPSRAELDLLDAAAVRAWLGRHRPDAVIHSATTPGHRNAAPVGDLALRNLKMFFSLAESAQAFGRLIVLGSGAEYDQRCYRPKMSEEHAGVNVPADDTGFSKLVISRFVGQRPGWVHLRPFGVFGKYEDWEIRFISNAICKAIAGRDITLRQDRRFDYLYVDDLVEVVAHFLDPSVAGGVFNATPDQTVSLLEVAGLVREVSGKDLRIVVGAPGQGLEYSGDNARLRALLPSLRLTPLREAIGRLYRWYEENRGLIRDEALATDK